MDLAKKYKALLDKYEINTPLRLAHLFAQLEHESNLKPIQENLNYSAEGLLKIFKKYFDDKTSKEYARQPQKIANRVYANRMGNGDEKSGDGWKYRGRGFIQITGKSNYQSLSKDTGVDYVTNPDKLLTEADSMLSALWFWKKNNLNALADKDDVVGVTRRINGGVLGLAHRQQLLAKYKKVNWGEILN
jgi:putative chitinase